MERMDGRMDRWMDGWMDQVGLSTSSSRFSKKFPVISQKVAFSLWGLMLKYVNYTAKIRFLSIFVKFWGVTSVFPQFSSRGRE